jgi:hypothetical protein
MLRALGWVVVAVLAGAAVYELALALGAGSIGPAPGDDVTGAGAVFTAALLAIIAAVVLALVYAARPRPVAALLAPAAAAFLVPFVFTYDPYYAPTLRRYCDGGAVPLGWIVFVAALALVAGALTRARPRPGAAASSAVLVVLLFTAVFAADGH